MLINKFSKLQFFVVSLFVITPFVMSFEENENTVASFAQALPPLISSFAKSIRWFLIAILILISLNFLAIKENFKISGPVYFLSIFYFLQFLYALADGVDYVRFLLMSITCLFVPPIIGQAFRQDKRILKYFVYSIFLFLMVSLLLNGHLVLSGKRFFGFMNNPNIYGISTVFWMIILLLADNYRLVEKRFFVFLFIGIFLTMLFSGSRNAMVGVFLTLIINYHKKISRLLGGFIGLFLVFLIAAYFVDLSFVTSRFENFSNSVADSGRAEIWEKAYYAVANNFWWGNGMDANYRIAHTGNMHNCFLRFLLNMGMVFTVLVLLMYLISILKSYSSRDKVPLVLTGYIFIFALMNIGEDFFVGIGSSAFIYLLFIYGFINHYATQSNDTIRRNLYQ